MAGEPENLLAYLRHFMISKTDVSNVFLKRYGHHPSTPRWFDKTVQGQESARLPYVGLLESLSSLIFGREYIVQYIILYILYSFKY